ncbi:hypothetical protein TBLA_0A03230 [Henningerozyma blattae CBS 6284]|uniref:Uncharacterized protein n=1 Tax=Henningerozyma blattae (strain ATCC 34711 / CBS 6284 / DSM 70876 / NBRC 10599 / NRRL Y-10934 / UCD 77-7) TaxID=1071380 RepID=I2GVH1_HENB6|nr:hypothetical protein TBLA_0A03230 [Tetrapisispora blattae CBS 6284]CCH58123.1 hypothetical protein TBLA_0A03230 [Tetrapisispora blattae CBS 6284]
MNDLKLEIESLKNHCDSLQLEYNELSKKYNINEDPKQLANLRIKLLKQYNELRDTGLKLVQLIAQERNLSIKEIFQEMDISMHD